MRIRSRYPDYFRYIMGSKRTQDIFKVKTQNTILLQLILKVNLMKNKISSFTLIIAFLGVTLLSSCSRKMGCYYSIANENPVMVRTHDSDVQTCLRNVPETIATSN